MSRLATLSARFYYGWVIVAVCGLSLFVAFGVRLSFSVFFVALLDEFAWSRAGTSLIFSTSMIVFALVSTPAGVALDRWGVRRVFAAGAGLLALGLILSSRIGSLTQLTITYGVIVGLGITILGLGLQASVIARWFIHRRGVAIGLAFSGTGLGALLIIPATALLIANQGWRNAYLVQAALALAMIPLIIYFLRLSPARLGLHPEGEKPSPHFPKENENSAAAARKPEVGVMLSSKDERESLSRPARLSGGWTMGQVIQAPSFWLVIVASVGAIGPLRMLTVHQIAAIEDAGIDRLFAAYIIGLTGAVTALAFVFWGGLSDRIGRRWAYFLGSACLLVAIAILATLRRAESSAWLFGYALMLGLGEGSRSSLVTAVASDLFPGDSLGAVNGAVGSAFGLGAALFPWVAGRIYDQSASYTAAFALAAAAILTSTLALWLAPVVSQHWRLRTRQR